MGLLSAGGMPAVEGKLRRAVMRSPRASYEVVMGCGIRDARRGRDFTAGA
jgi:hypothetical protein